MGVQRKALARITGEKQRLSNNTALAYSIRHRFPYLDPLHHLQVELVRRWRVGEGDDRVQTGSHIFINGIAAGLRNIGEHCGSVQSSAHPTLVLESHGVLPSRSLAFLCEILFVSATRR